MRKLIRRSAGWVHTSLVIAMIIPLLNALGAEQPDTLGQGLCLKCLVIIFPVAVSDFAIEKCKGLLSYLIASILTFALTGIMAWTASGSLRQSGEILFWIYLVLVLCETTFVILDRLAERFRKIREADAAQEADPDWRPSDSILREPSFLFLVYFLAVYIIAVNINNPAVCNAALFSAVIYTLTTFLYQYVNATENYLSLNKRTCNLPSRRIYGIGSGMLALFLFVLIIAILPSFFTIANRHYRDLRELVSHTEIDDADLVPQYNTENIPDEPMAALMEAYGEVKPAPRWVIFLTYVIEIVVFTILAFAILKKIFTTFHDFRRAIDDNGDVVEDLKDTDEAVQTVTKTAPLSRRRLSERERIRKEYRKTIRRHRKDRPSPHETPLEIEICAGIADSEAGQELHRNYERARYGKEMQ